MAADEKILSLIRKLIIKTKEGNVNWTKTVKENAFTVSFPNYSLSVFKAGENILSSYSIGIYNDKGNLIESIAYSPPILIDPSLKILEEFYDLARRKAMGAGKAIIDLLSALIKHKR